MGHLNWEEVKKKYENNPSSMTETGRKFRVIRATNTAIYVDLPSGEHYISRKNLEKAAGLINQGRRIMGPADYGVVVCDERPAYAWAILRNMRIV